VATIFMTYPWLALAVAAALFALWRWRPVRMAANAAFVWIAYGVYESLMYARVLCSGECNIRVDLLIIYPLLLMMTVFAALRVWSFRAVRPRNGVLP
jgi:hypothetical protein